MERQNLVLSAIHKHHSPPTLIFRRLHWTVVMRWKRLVVGELHKHHSPSLLFSQGVLVVVRESQCHRVVAQ